MADAKYQMPKLKFQISKERVARWAWVAVWMAVIFAFSAQPQDTLDFGQDLWMSKLAHVLEYAVLAWLVQRALGGGRRAWWASLWWAAAYAATDEWHQSFVPGRTARVTDVVIDAAGAFMGVALHGLVRRPRLRR